MPIPAEYHELLNKLTAQLPVWADVFFAVTALWGLLLWLNGRKIVKFSFTIMGLLGGAAGGAAIMHAIWPDASLLLGIIVGAVAGLILSWVGFRLWMAMVLACVAFLLAPWCVAAWQGTEPVDPTQPIEAASREMAKEKIAQAAEALDEDSPFSSIMPDELKNEADKKDGEEAGPTVGDILREALARYREAWNAWWAELSGAARWSLVGVGSIAAAGAFAVGLIFPNISASLVAALAGATMVLTSLGRLGARYLQVLSDNLPSTPRAVLITLALATAMGVLIQWIFSRKSTDK